MDIVIQLGVPRQSGKDGSFDPELYVHRTGRAGRYGSTRTADAVLFYDTGVGERKTLDKLQDEMSKMGVDILPRPLPSPREIMDASYERAKLRCEEFENERSNENSLQQYFKDRLIEDNNDQSALLDRLASALAALSGLPDAVSQRSLLTADPRDRTVRVWTETGESLTPSEVTNSVKPIGGKLGRITIASDGSALFDLGAKKADKLLQAASDGAFEKTGWHFELPDFLPPL